MRFLLFSGHTLGSFSLAAQPCSLRLLFHHLHPSAPATPPHPHRPHLSPATQLPTGPSTLAPTPIAHLPSAVRTGSKLPGRHCYFSVHNPPKGCPSLGVESQAPHRGDSPTSCLPFGSATWLPCCPPTPQTHSHPRAFALAGPWAWNVCLAASTSLKSLPKWSLISGFPCPCLHPNTLPPPRSSLLLPCTSGHLCILCSQLSLCLLSHISHVYTGKQTAGGRGGFISSSIALSERVSK